MKRILFDLLEFKVILESFIALVILFGKYRFKALLAFTVMIILPTNF